jgi:N-acetylglutamate synthase-like GNAT family acetyltransferase
MQTRFIDGVMIRPLRDGDTATVEALLARVAVRSRVSEVQLAALARVDGDHHALLAYLGGDPEPAGIAQLVRDASAAKVFCAVADDYEGREIGAVLSRQLAADARAAGITELCATELSPSPWVLDVAGESPRALGFLSRFRRGVDVIRRGSARGARRAWPRREGNAGYPAATPSAPSAGIELLRPPVTSPRGPRR